MIFFFSQRLLYIVKMFRKLQNCMFLLFIQVNSRQCLLRNDVWPVSQNVNRFKYSLIAARFHSSQKTLNHRQAHHSFTKVSEIELIGLLKKKKNYIHFCINSKGKYLLYMFKVYCNNVQLSNSRSIITKLLIQLIILPDVQINCFCSGCDIARSGFIYAWIFYVLIYIY